MKAKRIKIGSQKEIGNYGKSVEMSVYVEIDLKQKNKDQLVLSICGNIGSYGGGQCYDSIKPDKFTDGWDQKKVNKLIRIWKRWHLNDLNAGCEHQRALKWGETEIVVNTYRLKSEIWKAQDDIKEQAIEDIKEKRHSHISTLNQNMLKLAWEIKGDILPKELEQYYELKNSEIKTDGWVYESEHPVGKMCKPCPTCGYKYGSAWLFEELPKSVIEFIESL